MYYYLEYDRKTNNVVSATCSTIRYDNRSFMDSNTYIVCCPYENYQKVITSFGKNDD